VVCEAEGHTEGVSDAPHARPTALDSFLPELSQRVSLNQL